MSCTATSSGAVAASAAVANAGNAGRLTFAQLTAGADAATLIVSDGASGAILCKLAAAIGVTVSAPVMDVAYNSAVYLTITGTTPVAIVHTIRG